VVAHAAHELEPHYVTTYLTELAAAFNSWYASERMIIDDTITTRKLAVITAIENTFAKGLKYSAFLLPKRCRETSRVRKYVREREVRDSSA
jgi:arginyl-tRNA synthetase